MLYKNVSFNKLSIKILFMRYDQTNRLTLPKCSDITAHSTESQEFKIRKTLKRNIECRTLKHKQNKHCLWRHIFKSDIISLDNSILKNTSTD